MAHDSSSRNGSDPVYQTCERDRIAYRGITCVHGSYICLSNRWTRDRWWTYRWTHRTWQFECYLPFRGFLTRTGRLLFSISGVPQHDKTPLVGNPSSKGPISRHTATDSSVSAQSMASLRCTGSFSSPLGAGCCNISTPVGLRVTRCL